MGFWKMPFHKNEVCGMVSLCEGIDSISFYSPVPLTSVHVDVKVVNFTAQVIITQEFVNKERNPLECIYFFPVEEEAAVVDFTAELEGRKIETKVKEKEAAREECNEAVRNRQTAFLLEETKPDIFEIKIGHLSPGAGCKITMTYLAGLARQVFVLTDGQVSNSSACIDLVRKNSSTNRVFTLGIGSSADRHLVKGIARAGKGTAAFTTQGEPITSKVIKQLKNGLQPCISQVLVKWGRANDFEGSGDVEKEVIETKKTLFGFGKTVKKIKPKFAIQSQVPSKIPPIYDGSRLIAYKILDGNIEANDEVTVKAKTPEGDLEVTLKLSKDNMIEGNCVHQLFARKMIQELEEKTEHDDKEENKKLITELGLKYKLASKHTSFVGFDEKQGKRTSMMVTKQIKNQLPHNGGHAQGEPITSKVIKQLKNGLQSCISQVSALTFLLFLSNPVVPPPPGITVLDQGNGSTCT